MNAKTKLPGIEGKKVLLTGASRGLGLGICKKLLEQGAIVIGMGRAAIIEDSEFGKLYKTHNPKGQLHFAAADVGDLIATKKVVSGLLEKFGTIDVLVNNAGLGMDYVRKDYQSKPVNFWEVESEKWETMMRVNAVAPHLFATLLLPGMVKQGWGRIINVGTTYRSMQRIGFSPYGPSKAALETATVDWAMELAGTGVTANVILPGGAANTDMVAGDLEHFTRTGIKLLSADIMGDPICWLISTEADNVSSKRVVGKFWNSDGPLSASIAAAVSNAGFVTPLI